jgi:hypothetical protein
MSEEAKEVATTNALIINQNEFEVSPDELPEAKFSDYVSTLGFAINNPMMGKFVASLPERPDKPGSLMNLANYIQSVFDSLVNNEIQMPLYRDMLVKKPIDGYKMGSYKVEGISDMVAEYKLLPLVMYRRRIYWDKESYQKNQTSGGKNYPICSSNNIVMFGYDKENNRMKEQGDGLYYTKTGDEPSKTCVRDCNTCEFRLWQGTFGKDRQKPKCENKLVVVGVTPDMDALHEITFNSYSMNKENGLETKISSAGRLYKRLELDNVPVDAAMKYNIQIGGIDAFSTFTILKGEPVINSKGEKISGKALFSGISATLSKADIAYAKVYRELALAYIRKTMQKDYERIEKAKAGIFVDIAEANVTETASEEHVKQDFEGSDF